MTTDRPGAGPTADARSLVADLARIEPIDSAGFLSDWVRLGRLLLLALACGSAIYGRMVLIPLQEAVRVGLSLSDNQLALLQGPALALPGLLAAIPVGFVVDRYSRRRILVGLGLLTALSGLLTAIAPTFFLLFLARCTAGLAPMAMVITVYSIVADLYAPAQRGRAMTVITVAEISGAGLAFLVGGLVLECCARGPNGWRQAMVWLSAPLIMSALALFAVRDPQRSQNITRETEPRQAWSKVWALRGLWIPLLGAGAAIQIADGAAQTWTVTVLSRDFGVTPGRIGAVVASAVMIAGFSGPFVGGLMADLSQRKGGPRVTYLLLGILAMLSALAGFFAVAPGLRSAACLLVLFLSAGYAISIIGFALLTIIVPQQVRGLSISMFAACNVLAGLGLAPLLVSGLSGLLGGAGMVGHSLSIICIAASVVAAITYIAGIPAATQKTRSRTGTSSSR